MTTVNFEPSSYTPSAKHTYANPSLLPLWQTLEPPKLSPCRLSCHPFDGHRDRDRACHRARHRDPLHVLPHTTRSITAARFCCSHHCKSLLARFLNLEPPRLVLLQYIGSSPPYLQPRHPKASSFHFFVRVCLFLSKSRPKLLLHIC